MLTRKDYQAIATIFRDTLVDPDWPAWVYKEALIDRLVVFMESDNARFDARRFKDACYELHSKETSPQAR